MVLPTSGNSIKFSEIEGEFGGHSTNAIGAYRISETYGGLTRPLDDGIPTTANSSTPIKWSDFHGKRLNVIVDAHTDAANFRVDGKTEYTNDNVNLVGSGSGLSGVSRNASDSSGHRVFIRVNKQIGSASGAQTNAALRTGDWEAGTPLTVDIGSSGKIIGAGGKGGDGGSGNEDGSLGEAGGAGSSGLGIDYNGTVVKVESGGLVQAGYGGGGGGDGEGNGDGGFPFDTSENAGGGGGGGGAGYPGGEGGDPGSADECGGSEGGTGGLTSAGNGGGGCDAGEGIDSGEGGQGADAEQSAVGGGGDGGYSAPGANGFAVTSESGASFTWAEESSNDSDRIVGDTNGTGVT